MTSHFPSIRSVLSALDEAELPTASATLQTAMALADQIQARASDEGRALSRDEALVLAGQQLDRPEGALTSSSPRKWTLEELEALYPPGVARWKRNSPMMAFMGVMALPVAVLWGLTWVFQSSENHVLGALGVLGGVALAFWGLKKLGCLTQVTDEVFFERLKQVDSDTLIRWYKSGECISYPLVWSSLSARGIRLSTR